MLDFLISPEQLSKELGQVILVDVREAEEFAESRIEGGILIPLGEIQKRASELNKEDNIVIYCAHGVRSLHALRALELMGFSRLRSLDGGIVSFEDWQKLSR